MNQKDLSDALVDQLNKSRRVTILVNGGWGIGKSHVVSDVGNGRLSEKQMNFIHLSLFGMNSLDEINKNLKREYLLSKSNQDETNMVKGMKAVFDNQTTRSVISHLSEKYIGLSIDPLNLLPLKLGDKFIVCFDDLERKSPNLPMDEILGLIEEISLKCKVIVIANEERIKESDLDWPIYKIFKEKVIDRTYTIDGLMDITVKKIIEEQMPGDDKFISDIRNTIFDFFIRHSIINMRTLEKSIAFVMDLRSRCNLDSVLTTLCCAIVNEDSLGQDLYSFSQKTRGKKDDSFYTKYSLRPNYEQLLLELLRFYSTNRLDDNKVKHYLNPNKTECELLLEELQEGHLKNETTLLAHFASVKQNLKVNNLKFFGSSEKLLYVLIHLQLCKNWFDISYDMNELKEWYLNVIVQLAQNGKINNVENIKLIYNQTVPFLNTFLDQYELAIQEQSGEYYLKKYTEYFDNKDYNSCSEIVHKHPGLILSIIDNLDLVAKDICTRELFAHLRLIVDISFRDKTNVHPLVEIRLSNLLHQTNDKVIKHRIKSLQS
ncbi:P-loop NTPase fold protein [Paenibacillus amylolyticus]